MHRNLMKYLDITSKFSPNEPEESYQVPIVLEWMEIVFRICVTILLIVTFTILLVLGLSNFNDFYTEELKYNITITGLITLSYSLKLYSLLLLIRIIIFIHYTIER